MLKLFDILHVCYALQALQAPACHENMVKVGGYILGEFGNLIAGDQRSSPAVQFQLLHSKVSIFTFLNNVLVHVHVYVYTNVSLAVSSMLSYDSSIAAFNVHKVCQPVP